MVQKYKKTIKANIRGIDYIVRASISGVVDGVSSCIFHDILPLELNQRNYASGEDSKIITEEIKQMVKENDFERIIKIN